MERPSRNQSRIEDKTMKVNTLIIETEDGSWAIAINPLNKLKDILIKEELI